MAKTTKSKHKKMLVSISNCNHHILPHRIKWRNHLGKHFFKLSMYCYSTPIPTGNRSICQCKYLSVLYLAVKNGKHKYVSTWKQINIVYLYQGTPFSKERNEQMQKSESLLILLSDKSILYRL